MFADAGSGGATEALELLDRLRAAVHVVQVCGVPNQQKLPANYPPLASTLFATNCFPFATNSLFFLIVITLLEISCKRDMPSTSTVCTGTENFLREVGLSL